MGGRAGARMHWEWASSSPVAVPRVSGLIPACPPPLAGLMASFLFPEVSSVGSPWVGLAAWPRGATGSPSMAEARCGRKKSGAHPTPPAHCFDSLHPGPFELPALLSLSPRALSLPAQGRGLGSTQPPYFSLLLAASAMTPTHVWPELLLQVPRGEAPPQSVPPRQLLAYPGRVGPM